MSDLGYDCTNTTCTDPNAVCADATLLCSCPTGYFDSNGAALGGTCESVLYVILAVTIACFIKHRRTRLDADHEDPNMSILDSAIHLQELASEQDQ
ncbi:hypothetical protein MAR_018188, partial [Mya arenaria]